jgi:endonuclease/exonuclease/phosphatase family metal-dependent hydrolase
VLVGETVVVLARNHEYAFADHLSGAGGVRLNDHVRNTLGDQPLNQALAMTSYGQLSTRRVAVNAAVYVNGRLINIWSTHLDSRTTTSSYRIAEVKALQSCVSSFAQQRIIAGDFNARDFTTEINSMESAYYDGWAEAAADGTAISYPGNTAFGATRNTRIDYVWATVATAVTIKSAQVYDTRDSRGYMPSDHKPLMVTFEVR